MKTVVIGTRAEAAEIKDVIAITDRAEAALEMVRYGLAERVIISKSVLGVEQAEALRDFMTAFYPKCHTDFIGAVREIGDTERCGETVVLVVYSVKGGTGCTTLACNMGALMQTTCHLQTGLLDFARPVGDMHIHLDVNPDTTLVDCLPFVEEAGTLNIESVMKQHDSGLMLLCGISEARLAQLAEDDRLVRIAQLAVGRLSVVIIDAGSHPELAVRLAGLRADVQLIMVVTPDVCCLSRARQHLKTAGEESWVVLNNWPADACITDQEAAHFLPRQQLAGKIGSFQHLLGRSVVAGRPLVLTQPQGQLAAAITDVCHVIVPGMMPVSEPEKDGWLHNIVKKVKR